MPNNTTKTFSDAIVRVVRDGEKVIKVTIESKEHQNQFECTAAKSKNWDLGQFHVGQEGVMVVNEVPSKEPSKWGPTLYIDKWTPDGDYDPFADDSHKVQTPVKASASPPPAFLDKDASIVAQVCIKCASDTLSGTGKADINAIRALALDYADVYREVYKGLRENGG